jgi:hypothetical protein
VTAVAVSIVGRELVGRPTDQAVTLKASADQSVQAYVEYGTTSGSYTGQTAPAVFAEGLIEVVVVREPDRLTVTVADTGVGLPEGFELDSATSLGLQIVRTLVVGELGGRLRITPRPGGGTEAVVDLPVGNEPDRETVT